MQATVSYSNGALDSVGSTATIGQVRLVVLSRATYTSIAVVLICIVSIVHMVTRYVALRSNYFGFCTLYT